MLTRRTQITTVDIGASNTTTVIAEVDGYGYVELQGHAQSPTQGFEDDMVNDIRELGDSIAASVEAAEDMAGQRVAALIVSVGGEHVRVLQSRGGVPLQANGKSGRGRVICRQDIKRAIENAGTVPMSDDLQPLNVLPLNFYVDGSRINGQSPEGLSGTRLDVEVMIIVADKAILNSISKAAEYQGYRVKEFCYRPMATGRAVLSKEEMDQGTCLVDVGAQYTDVAVFREGRMLFTSTLEIGGDDITVDASHGMDISLAEAEKIKIKHGHCSTNLMEDSEFQVSGGLDGSLWRTIRKSDLGHKIIQPRVEEILEEAFMSVCSFAENESLPANAVITGGTSQLPGFNGLAASIFPFPVSRAENSGFENMDEIARKPDHSTALGMVLLEMDQKFNRREDVMDNPVSRWYGKIMNKIHTVM